MPTKVLGRDQIRRFEFHLARELKMTRDELLRRMSGEEFAYWIALYQREERERKQNEAEQRRKGQLRQRGFNV